MGVGTLKHVEVKHLRIQEKVSEKLVKVSWIPRKHNPSDLLTHTLLAASFFRLLGDFGVLWQLPPSEERHLRGVSISQLRACVWSVAIWLTSYVMRAVSILASIQKAKSPHSYVSLSPTNHVVTRRSWRGYCAIRNDSLFVTRRSDTRGESHFSW